MRGRGAWEPGDAGEPAPPRSGGLWLPQLEPLGTRSVKSGGAVPAEVDGDPSVLVVEHGDEFQAGAEGFEVLAQGRDPYVLGVFEFRDGSLGDIEPAGELGPAGP